MRYLAIILCFVAFSACGRKTVQTCYPLPELYAFMDSAHVEADTFSFSKPLLKSTYEHVKNKKINQDGYTFMYPMIVKDLILFYPDCGLQKDQETYEMLLEVLYHNIGKKYNADFSLRKETLETIASDFKKSCQVDSLYASMVSFFKGGPFYGSTVTEIDSGFILKDTLYTDIGEILLYTNKEQGLVVFNGSKTKWIKQLNPDFSIEKMKFFKSKKNILGYEISMGDTENYIYLHLSTNGDFRFYLTFYNF